VVDQIVKVKFAACFFLLYFEHVAFSHGFRKIDEVAAVVFRRRSKLPTYPTILGNYEHLSAALWDSTFVPGGARDT